MKKPTTLLFLLLNVFTYNTLLAQTLEIVSGPTENEPYAITYQDKAFIVNSNADHFLRYDGVDYLRFNFPARDGRRLTFTYWNPYEKNEVIEFRSTLYLILNGSSGSRFLYGFNGSSFSHITLPGNPVSNPVIYEGLLYLLVQVGDVVKLVSYDGSAIAEIPSSEIPITHNYHIIIAGQYLYAIGKGYYRGEPFIIKRYDGSGFFTLPHFEFFRGIKDIQARPGTDEVYINVSNNRIFFFNGSALSEIYNEGYNFSSFQVWNNVLYFLDWYNLVIFQHDGSSFSELDLPESAAPWPYSNLVVYRDKLMIPTEVPGRGAWMFEYDGRDFVRSFEFPVPLNNPVAFIKNENYGIITNPRNGPIAFEYDGTSYTEVSAPDEKHLAGFLTSTSCVDLWHITYYNPLDYVSVIGKIDLGCPPATTTIIPEGLTPFDRIDIGLHGRYRDWCWTDIFIDWEIVPICPIPEVCSGPKFKISLTDLQGKENWNYDFSKPMDLQFPIEEKPHTLTLSTVTDNYSENLFIVDDDLVSKGLSVISMSIVPKEDYFLLKAETDKGDVPFMLSLLNKEGKAVWQSEFIAPMEKEITDRLKEPGNTLRFSSVPGLPKKLEAYGITNIKFYPNPNKGKLAVDIETKSTKVPATVIITNLRGETIYTKQIIAPIQHTIEMQNHKPGLYIITLRVGEVTISEQIQLED